MDTVLKNERTAHADHIWQRIYGMIPDGPGMITEHTNSIALPGNYPGGAFPVRVRVQFDLRKGDRR